MSPRRRPLRGSPLLVSAAGAVITIACSGGGGGMHHPPGNLMAPPVVQVCVTATPPEALVKINGNIVDENGCSGAMEGGQVTIEAELDGYQPYNESYPMEGVPHDIVLVPVATEE